MINSILDNLEINVTPLEEMKLNTTDISIEFDDSEEIRWRASISPYQAFRATAIDCIATEPFMIGGKRPFHILEITHSDWLNELRLSLAKKDVSASFLEKSHHYVFPFQDIIIEVIGWEIKVEKL